jgi:hypothetical protein
MLMAALSKSDINLGACKLPEALGDEPPNFAWGLIFAVFIVS